jgi:hypothetical protein
LPKSILVLACAAVAVTALPLKADTITTFSATGSFSDVAGGSIASGGTDTLSGTSTVTIDTTSGTATAWDVTITLSPDLSSYLNTTSLEFNSAPTTTTVGGGVDISGLASNANVELDLYVPSLMNYSGGNLFDTSSGPPYSQFAVPGGEGSYAKLDTGELTPSVSPSVTTPEPASITLLVSGLLTAGGFGLVRRRRGTTAS